MVYMLLVSSVVFTIPIKKANTCVAEDQKHVTKNSHEYRPVDGLIPQARQVSEEPHTVCTCFILEDNILYPCKKNSQAV